MKSSAVKNLLRVAFQKNLRVLLVGKPGTGKSSIVEQVVAELGYDLILMHPSVADPTDFKGFPSKGEDGGAVFLPFGDLKYLISAKRPCVCFLDDIGQASPAVQAALMQLVLARRVNGHKISDFVIFCGATNDTTHMAFVSGMIEPLKSRWDTIVTLDVDPSEWDEWAEKAGMPVEERAFIKMRPDLLSNFTPTKELKNSPSPRGWESVGKFYNLGIVDREIYAGAVGDGAAVEFLAKLKLMQELPDREMIVKDPKNCPVPKQPAMLYAVTLAGASMANKKTLKNVMTYFARLPKEFEALGVQSITRRDPALKETVEMTKWACDNASVLTGA